MTMQLSSLLPQEHLHHLSATITGEGDVLRLAPELDELAARTRAGVLGRAVWTLPDVVGAGDRAWAVEVRRRGGQLAGAAVFVDQIVDGEPVVTLAGTEGGFGVTLLAEDADTGAELVTAVGVRLAEKGCRIELGPVRGADQLVRGLRDELAGDALVLADEPIPHLVRDAGEELSGYVSHNMRKTLRRAANRLRVDGLAPRLEFASDPARVQTLLPDLAAAYQDRDHIKGRPSQLDSAVGRRVWERRLLHLVERAGGEVVSLMVDDQLVAYVLGVRHGSWYGIREGRFLTDFSRYAPGRLLEAAVVQRALYHPGLQGVDWLSSVAPETLLAANGATRALRLSLPARIVPTALPRQRQVDETPLRDAVR